MNSRSLTGWFANNECKANPDKSHFVASTSNVVNLFSDSEIRDNNNLANFLSFTQRRIIMEAFINYQFGYRP